MNRMEEHNYWRDPRTQAGMRDKPDVDENRMVMILRFGEEEIELPFEWVVCSLCNGKGSHVNPSIDAGGITGQEFREDPDFYEDYRNGLYDVPCNECKGKRVVPSPVARTPEQKEDLDRYWEWRKEEAAYARMCAAERAMGA